MVDKFFSPSPEGAIRAISSTRGGGRGLGSETHGRLRLTIKSPMTPLLWLPAQPLPEEMLAYL
eukprot:140278-Prorocentrum_minimum.AAC.1